MKPSTLIVMSVGLLIAVVGFVLCLGARNSAAKNYPENDLFSADGENYQIIDGDSVRTEDFSDTVYVMKDEKMTEVHQDVKVLSVKLKNVDEVEIVGRSAASRVMCYNMQPGTYTCRIGSGIMTVTNEFEEALAFDFFSDIVVNFNGIRKYFNPDFLKNRAKKVIVTINDADVLNRIDLELTNCKNVSVRNLTCSLDCKVVLNNSSVSFDSCRFKEKEIIYPDPDPNVVDSDNNVIQPDPITIEHFFTLDLNMKNGSVFNARNCTFSSVDALVNKKQITKKDVEAENSIYTPDQIGGYVSSGGSKCTLTLDVSTSGVMYGYNITNTPDEATSEDVSLVTIVNGYAQSTTFMENAGSEDFPQIRIDASNCAITVVN